MLVRRNQEKNTRTN